MAGKQFKTSLVISGDSRGAVTAVRATHDELGRLARQQASAERGADRYGSSVAAVAREHAGLSSEIDAGTGSLRTWSGVAASAGVAAATAMAVAQARSAKETQIMADALGMSAGQMSEFAYAAKEQGLEAGQSMDLLKDIAEKVGDALKFDGGEGKEALEELGLSAEELVKKSPVDMLMDIAAALEDFDSTAEKSAALEMFGNDLTRLLPLLDNGAEKYRAMAQQGRELNVVLSDADISGMADVADAFERLADAGTGQFSRALAQIAPAITSVADLLTENLDTVGYGVLALSGLLSGKMVSSLMATVAAQQAAKVAAAQQAAADMAAAKAADVKVQSALRVAKSEQAAAQRALANAQAMTVATQASYARKKALDALAVANARVAASEKVVAASSLELSGNASVAGRAGKGLTAALGLFGGPWGLAVVAGISAITFAMNAQATQAKATANELQRVTELADAARAKAAEPVSMQGNLAAEQQALSQLQSQVAETERSMARIRKQLDAGGLPTATVVALSETYATLQTSVAGADDQIKAHQAEIDRLKSGLQSAGVEVEGVSGQTAGQAKAVQDLIEKLQQEELQLRLSERAMLQHQLSQQAATDQQVAAALAAYDNAEALHQKAAADKAAAEETERAAKAYQSWLEQVRDAADPARKLSEEIEKINAAVASGDLTEAQGKAYIKKLKKGFKKSADAGEDEFAAMADRVAQTLQDTIAAGEWDEVGVAIGAVMAGEIAGQVSTQLAVSLKDQMGAQAAGIAGAFGGAVVGGALTYLLTSSGTELTDDSGWRQEQQGTGTVLGDMAAQSASIANATDITADATEDLVGINRDMLRALQSVQAGISGASTLIARGAGAVQFADFEAPESQFVSALDDALSSNMLNLLGGGVLGGLASSLFGGSSKVTDSGIQIAGGSLGYLQHRVDVDAYQDTKYKKWRWGSTRRRTDYADLDAQVGNQFAAVFDSIAGSVHTGAMAIGLAGSDVERAINDFEIATTQISLKGLSAKEQQAQIQAEFSKVFDGLAADVIPFLGDFQMAGEGLGETLARIATQVQVADEAVYRLGFNAEHKTAEQFSYLSNELIKASGGIESFISGMSGFVDTFAPEAHQFELLTSDMTRALADVGLEVPASRDAMWDLMQTLDAGTESGRAQIATLLRVSDTADEYYTALNEGARATEAAAEAERQRLQAITDFNSGIQTQLDQMALDGQDLELFNLDQEFDRLRAEAEEVGGDLALVEALYGQKRADIVAQYAQEAAEAAEQAAEAERQRLQAITDFNSGIQTQLDQLALSGQDLELFNLDQEFARLRAEAAEVGGDLALVEQLYGQKRADIVEQYAQQAAEAAEQAAEAERQRLQAITDFNSVIQTQLDQLGLDGKDLELFNLSAEFDRLRAEAEEVGGDLALVEALYGQKRADIVAQYAQEAAEAAEQAAEAERQRLQAITDFNTGIQTQLDQMALEGQDLELFNLGAEFDRLRAEAAEVGGDLALVEALYGQKRAAIVEQYAEQAQQALESSVTDGLGDYLSQISDYVSDELRVIEQDYQERISLLESQQRMARELRGYVDQIRLSELNPAGPAEKLSEASEQFAALLVKAENGDMDAAGQLQSAANAYLENADSYYGRTGHYAQIFADVTSSIDQLGIDLGADTIDQQIAQLNDQMLAEQQQIRNYAQQELSWAQTQSEQLTGIAGLLASWPEQFAELIQPEPEAPAMPDRPGVERLDGSHANGLNSVPFDGYRAELHQNEMILTADVADHIRASMRVGAAQAPQVVVQTDPAVVQELQRLQALVARLESEQRRANGTAEQQRASQKQSTDTVARELRSNVEVSV